MRNSPWTDLEDTGLFDPVVSECGFTAAYTGPMSKKWHKENDIKPAKLKSERKAWQSKWPNP